MKSVVVLLEGDVSELPLLSSATTIRELVEAPLEMAWIDGPHGAARSIMAELASDLHVRPLDPPELHQRLRTREVRGVMMSQAAWARHAGRLWSELEGSNIYVRRQGVDQPRRLLCCADSEETAAGLLARVGAGPWFDSHIAVVHALAPPPMWVQAVCQMHGVPLPPPEEPRFTTSGSRCPRVVIDGADPEVAVRSACLALEPDLVVLGWHRHQLPLPSRWLHPTAWRLSTRLPHDVLLVPLTAPS